MADETPQKPKVTVKETDTSRMKTGPTPAAPPPKVTLKETDTSRLKTEAAAGAPPARPAADATQQKPKVTLTQTDTKRLKAERAAGNLPPRPAAPPLPPSAESARPGQTVKLTDPMALRDTNTGHLRRIEPGAQTTVTGAAVAPDAGLGDHKKGATETVRLKVMREPKKEASPEAGQTARLRPPTVAIPPGGAAEPGLRTVTPPSDASKTVTIKGPLAAAGVEVGKAQAQTAEEGKTSTSRLTRIGGTKAAEAAPDAGSAHHTVKIKLPAISDEMQEAGEPSATAVLPAPGEGAASTVKVLAEPAAGAKRTIRIRSQKPPVGAPALAPAAQAVAAMAAAAPAEAVEADTVTTVALVVMLLGLAAMLYFLVTQVVAHVL